MTVAIPTEMPRSRHRPTDAAPMNVSIDCVHCARPFAIVSDVTREQVEIGRNRTVGGAERVDIEHAAIFGAGLAGDLLGRLR